MKRRNLRLSTRFAASESESGASLILALIFLTVVSLVALSVISLATVNVGVTAPLREQRVTTYAADGAAQVAIEELKDTLKFSTTDTSCNGPLLMEGSETRPAVKVVCDRRVTQTSGGGAGHISTSTPAIVTLSSSTGNDGLYFSGNTKQNPLTIGGGVFSHSGIYFDNTNSTLDVTNGNVRAAQLPCPADKKKPAESMGAITPGCTKLTGDDGRDPEYQQPAGELTPRTVPASCPSDKALKLQPGLYTNAEALNALTSSPKNNCTIWLAPSEGGGESIYYFDFSGTQVWSVTGDKAFVIGGTPTSKWNPGTGTGPSIPGSCASPKDSATNGGIRIILGGQSRLEVTNKGKMEVCGAYSDTQPPIAIFGATVDATSGGRQFHKQTGCIVSLTCTAVKADSTDTKFLIHGTTYIPRGKIDLTINNGADVRFTGGIFSQTLKITMNGSSTAVVQPFIDERGTGVEAGAGLGAADVAFTVHVCPTRDSLSCASIDAAKRPDLKTLVAYRELEHGGASAKVLAWNIPR